MNPAVTPSVFGRAQLFEVRVTELSLSSRRDMLSVTTAADIHTGDRTHWFRGQAAVGIDEDDLEETPVNTIMNAWASTINVMLLTDKISSSKGFTIEVTVRERFLPGCPNARQERIDVSSSSGVLRYPPNSGRHCENCLRKTWVVSQPAGPFQNTVCAAVALPAIECN